MTKEQTASALALSHYVTDYDNEFDDWQEHEFAESHVYFHALVVQYGKPKALKLREERMKEHET